MSGRPAGAPAIVAAVLSIASVGVAISLAAPLVTLTLAARGVSETMIGVIGACYGIAALVTTPQVARHAARLSFLPVFSAALVVAALSLAALPWLASLWFWALASFLIGGAVTICFVLSESWINSAAPSSRRGLVIGVYATILSLGFATGPALLAVVGTDPPTPFFIAAGAILAALVPIWAARRHVPRLEASDAPVSFARHLLLTPVAMVGVFAFAMSETAGFNFLPLYGKQIGLEASLYTLLPAVMTLGNVALQIPLGILTDRINRRLVLVSCGVAGLLGALLIFPLADHPGLLLANLFIWGGVSAGLYTVGLAQLGARFAGAALASANAAFVFSYSVATLLSPLSVGAAMDHFGPVGLPGVLVFTFAFFLLVALSEAIAGQRRSAA